MRNCADSSALALEFGVGRAPALINRSRLVNKEKGKRGQGEKPSDFNHRVENANCIL